MKSLAYYLFAILLISSHLSFGQYFERPAESIKASTGLVLLGAEGIPGVMVKANYDYDKIPYLRLGTGFSLLSASRTASEEFRYHRTQAISLDLKVGLSPFKNQWSALFLNAGVSTRYASIYSNPTIASKTSGDSFSTSIISTQKSFSPGYLISADYELYFSEKWIFATEAAVQDYANGATLAFFGVKAGVWL